MSVVASSVVTSTVDALDAEVAVPTRRVTGHLVKSMLDRTLALLLLAVAIPIMLALVLAIRLDSSGPAIFRQTRIGRNGRPFTMYKFRSMRSDAELVLDQLLDQNESAGGVLFKIRHDPRITKVGGFLRRSSLDELPQLLNVLRGDMSLVGPRPALPHEVEQYDELPRRRLDVKPGITGLWQVSGRSDLAWDDAIRLDLEYVEGWSLRMDLAILCRTAGAVLSRRGAY